MRSPFSPDIHHMRWSLKATSSKYRPPFRPCHRPSQLGFVTQRQSSTWTTWTEDGLTRIHIHGLNNYGMLYGNGLARMTARPPLTFMVPTNWRVLKLAELNGEIEVIEGDDSYIADGFDIEANPPFSDNGGALFPSNRRIWVNTLTLPAKTNFDVTVENHPEDPYLPYDGWEKNYGAFVKFKSDPSLLSYGSGASDQRLVVESKPVPRHISPSDLVFMDTELAKESRGPIRSLILAVDAMSVVSSLLTYKERLKQDSTILFTQKGMGIMEMVNEQVFPDPSSRPNYMAGILSHQLWSDDDNTIKPDLLSHSLNQQHSGAEEHIQRNSLTVKHTPRGCLLLGPVVPVEGETPKQAAKRQRRANYFVSALLGAEALRTRRLDERRLLFYRLRDVAINSVVWPMTVRYSCYQGGILENDERRAHARSRLREAARVVQADCPTLTYDYLEQRLGEYVAATADNTNMMFKSVISGKKSSIDFLNGWLVRRGKSFHPAIQCPGHEEDIAYIEEMTKTMGVYLYEKKLEENRLAREAQREAQRQQEEITKQEKEQNRFLREQDELARLLHNRKIREERKKVRQQRTLERARKKPALETPSIMGLGNSALVKAAAERFKSPRIRKILFGKDGVEKASPPIRAVGISKLASSAPEIGKGPRVTRHLSDPGGYKIVPLDLKKEPSSHADGAEVGSEAFKSSL